MARALGLAVALFLLAAPPAGAFTEPSSELVAGSEESVLRLHDLPPGYRLGEESGCGPLGPFIEGGPGGRFEKRYPRWLFRYRPGGCGYQYEQIFEVPGLEPAPPLVEAGTVNTPSEAAAGSGFGLYITLVNHEKDGRRRKTVSIPPSGVRAVLFRSNNLLVQGRIHQAATILFWRSGKLISFVEAAGMNPRRNDSAALSFAQIQQERLEHPSPYTEAERDDTEIWLDDPGLKFPIYWVGRRFEPGHGLPATELEEAISGWVGPPGQKTGLWYEDFILGSWTRRSWKTYAKTRLGKANLAARCTTKEPLPLEGGSAVIFGTYTGRFRECPERKPDLHYAIARLGGMVVGLNLGICITCGRGSTGPYGTKRGVMAILRALEPRPKPIYDQP
jgi:hypothetical protein